MTVALPTPDVQAFRAFTGGDEHALESIFRSEYDALIAQATEALGPECAHNSGRVVQQAMLAAWRRRSEFTEPHGLVAFLESAVQDEAAVQKRKHSALHHGKHSHTAAAPRQNRIPTPDEAVASIHATLHAPPPDHDRLIEEARQAKKHHAAEHVQSVGRKSSWVIPTVLVVVAAVVIIAAQRWAQDRGSDIAATKALQSEEARDINSLRGQRGTVTLGDDSRATVGSDSRLRVPKEFGLSLRTLELTGTARFVVSQGKPLPFTVRVGNLDIVATGTDFTVRAFPDDSTPSVMVREGSVQVRVRDTGDDHTVSAGQAVRIARDGSVSAMSPAIGDAAFAWTRDSLVINDMPLREVVPQLVRWYDLKLAIGDPSINDQRVTARLGLESSGAALEAVRKAAGLVIEFGADKEVVLKRGG
ncbi:MAG TPA: FecR domain-containing protein [Gemmatimonas sp.]|nr:FecR domain-containing protein [Gemmatimonas sp.]